MFSLIVGMMEASIEMMGVIIPILLKICYFVFIVLPIALIEMIAELIRRLICYIRGKEYVAPPQPVNVETEVKSRPKPVHLQKKVYKVKRKPRKRKWHEPYTIDEMILYDIIDGD